MLLQFPSISAFTLLSFTSYALALSPGHARLHHHPAQAQRLDARMVPRGDASSVEIPLNLLQLLRTQNNAFQDWMGAWLELETTTDSVSSVALLRQEIQAYEGWMTAWLHAATSDNAPTAIPLPPSIPVTASPLPASTSQVLPTSRVNLFLSSGRLDTPSSSSSGSTSSTTALPVAGEFLQLHQSVGGYTYDLIKPSHTSFVTVKSQKPANAPSSTPSSRPISTSLSPPLSTSSVRAPISTPSSVRFSAPFSSPISSPFLAPSSAPSASLVQTSKPLTVTPVPPISTVLSQTPAATLTPSDSTQPGSKGFNAKSNQNLAVYYGQSPATAQTSLRQLCQNPNVDIVILAFLTEFFGPGGFPKLNFGAACGGQTPEMKSAGASGLLSCPDLASQIAQCQSLGKKVLLSLGGSLAVSSFPSDAHATKFATTLWNLFGAGTGVNPGLRPFGNVKIDGFDVDNEDHSTSCYSTFVTSLRKTMNADKSKTYYISAAPQCPRPDASIPLDAMQAMDFIFIQFYNNAAANCNVGQPGFINSLKAWSADLSAKGAGPRLYVGAPGCVNCAGTGYLDPTTITSVIADAKRAGVANFGGAMLWDGSEAMANVQNGKNFLTVLKNSLR